MVLTMPKHDHEAGHCCSTGLVGQNFVTLCTCTSVHLHTCTSVHLHICTPIHLYIYTSVHLHNYTSAQLYTCTAIPPHNCSCSLACCRICHQGNPGFYLIAWPSGLPVLPTNSRMASQPHPMLNHCVCACALAPNPSQNTTLYARSPASSALLR